MKHTEFELQKSICKYLDLKYPNVLYLSDTIASVKLTLPQAARNKSIQKQGFKCPDLLILQPNDAYYGLFIELKKESPYKKSGGLKKCDHLEAQNKTIEDLMLKGYFACFSWTYEGTIKIIEDYLSNNL